MCRSLYFYFLCVGKGNRTRVRQTPISTKDVFLHLDPDTTKPVQPTHPTRRLSTSRARHSRRRRGTFRFDRCALRKSIVVDLLHISICVIPESCVISFAVMYTVVTRLRTTCSTFAQTQVPCLQTRTMSYSKRYNLRYRQPLHCVRRISASAAWPTREAKSSSGPGTRCVPCRNKNKRCSSIHTMTIHATCNV